MNVNQTELYIYLLGLVVLFLGYKYQNILTRRNELIKQLSDKRYKAYHNFINYFFDFYKEFKFESKNRNNLQNIKANVAWSKRLIDIQAEMMIYSNDKIMKLFIAWRKQSENAEISTESLSIYYIINIIVEIRKDMGNERTIINESDIMSLISEDYKLIMDRRPAILPID